MEIELREISIREIVNGYKDSQENGVVGYEGKLNIRPAFQREFIYKEKQRDEVISTIRKGFPLNVMYWVKAGDGYELMDGQQRTISFCQYVNGDFSHEFDGHRRGFDNLTKTAQEQILNYKIMVYICDGTDEEKLDWFKIINIAGEQLTNQELRNAIFTGTWLTDAKRHFSKNGCPAYKISNEYMSGSAIRQDYLQTALMWISNRDNIGLEDYMAAHQHDENAQELWVYFQNVINWVKIIFPKYRKEMKGLNWGGLYNKYKDGEYDPIKIENRIVELFSDDDVTNHKGIFEYILSGENDEKYLSIRAFDNRMRRYAYEMQKHKCKKCGKEFELEEMQADHITPWSKGGKTIQENCQMLCADCNRRKSDV